MCLSSKSETIESLKIHRRLHLHVLQPPVKFHDVVPNGKFPATKRDISKTETPFLLEIPCLYMTHRPLQLHAIITNGTRDMIRKRLTDQGDEPLV